MIDNLDTKEAMQRGRAIEEALAPFDFRSHIAKDIAATDLLDRVSRSVIDNGFVIDGVPIKVAVKQELAGRLSFCIAPKSVPANQGAGVRSDQVPVGGLAALQPSERRAVIAATFRDRIARRRD